MDLLAQASGAGPVVVRHIYLWQIVAVGSAAALAAVLILFVFVTSFRRNRDDVEDRPQ